MVSSDSCGFSHLIAVFAQGPDAMVADHACLGRLQRVVRLFQGGRKLLRIKILIDREWGIIGLEKEILLV